MIKNKKQIFIAFLALLFVISLVPKAYSFKGVNGKKEEEPKAPTKLERERGKKENLVKELLSDLEKVDRSIQIVKDEVDQTREKKFIPTLLLRLAELYVEKGRILFYKAKEEVEGGKGSVEAPEAKESKLLAIETYKRIIRDYPNYPDIVTVRFFMAHEMREINDIGGMVKQYEIIVDRYGKSKYKGEALLLLGDFHFDRRRISRAADYYRRIIKSGLNATITSMARYKLAWCYINDHDHKKALYQFEKIARSAKKHSNDEREARLGKSTLVREALIDSVLSFTEVKKPSQAIPFYKSLADSEITYSKVLEKLANRYFIKKDLKNSTKLYRELIQISGELEDNIEYLKRILQFSRDVKNRKQAVEDIDYLIRNLNRYLHSFRIDEEDKRVAYQQFEVYARDIATKLHLKADQTKKSEYYDASAKAYKQYLTLFKDSAYAKDIQLNFADTLYASKQYLEAGEQYETIYKKTTNKKGKSDALYAAVSAYFDAIKNPKELDKVQLIDARQGFIKTAKEYIEKFPKNKKTPELRFAIGKTHYDLREYDQAIQGFNKFINDYPNHKMTVDAGQLVLDCYNAKKDYKGMVEQGKIFLANKKIKNRKFRKEVGDLVKKTEFVMIQEKSDKKKMGAFADDFFKYSRKYRGTNLGEKALYNAYQMYRKRRDKKNTFIAGTQFLIQYPNSKFLKDVYPTLGQIAFETANYDEACYYFENFHRKYPRERLAIELLKKAAELRTLLLDAREAISDYQKLLSTGQGNSRSIYKAMAENYERMGRWSNVISSVNQAISLGDNSIESNAKLAVAYFNTRNFRKARQAIARVRKIATSRGAARLSREDYSHIAHSEFIGVEMTFVDFKNIRTGRKANEAKLVERKNKLLQEMEQLLVQVSQYKDNKWIIATIFRIGQAYENFGAFLRSTSVPKNLNSAQRKQYRQILAQKIDLMGKKAKETYKTALKKAYSLGIYNNWVKSCAQGSYVKEKLKIRRSASVNREDKKRINDLYTRLLSKPRDTRTLNKVAMLYMRNRDFGMAKFILERSLEIRSRSASTINSLGVAHWYMGDDQEAYNRFSKVARSSGYSKARINQAAMQYEFGNKFTAKKNFARIKGAGKTNMNAINVIPPAKLLLQ